MQRQSLMFLLVLMLGTWSMAAAADSAWDGRLLTALHGAITEGRQPHYFSTLYRKEVSVIMVEDSGQVVVRLDSGEMTVPLRLLTAVERQQIAMGCLREDDVASLAVALYYCHLTGNQDDAVTVRLRAGNADMVKAMEAVVASDPPSQSLASAATGATPASRRSATASSGARQRSDDQASRPIPLREQREAAARQVYLEPGGHGPGFQPQHGLRELASRQGWYDPELNRMGQGYASERTVYCDTDTGRLVWRMTRNPGLDEHGYYDTLAWNANGSLMLVDASRRGGGSQPITSWLMDADGSHLRPMPPGRVGAATESKGYWSVQKPEVYYVGTRGGVDAINPFTGERTSVARGKIGGGWLMPPHPSDDWFLFCEGWEVGSKAWVLGRDGSVRQIDTGKTFCWLRFTGSKDQRIFYEVQKGTWEQWTILPDGSSKHRVTGGTTKGGHAGWTLDGAWMTFMGSGSGGYAKIRPDGSEQQTFLRGAMGGCHGLPCRDGLHFVSDTDQQYSGGGAILRSTFDGKLDEVVCRHQSSFYYHGASAWRPHYHSTHPHPNASPDGTKIVYNSDMIGHFSDMYVAIAKLPDAPAALTVAERNGTVSLTWEPGLQHRETAGYLIYRSSSSSRDGWERVTDDLVTDRQWHGPGSDQQRYYVVTAVEYSGLESTASPVGQARKGGETTNSEGGGFLPDRAAPAAPGKISVDRVAPTALALRWRSSADADVDHYNVYASNKEFTRCEQARLIASPSETGFVDQGLQLNQTYHYLVTAVDRNGNESSALPVSGETEVREVNAIVLEPGNDQPVKVAARATNAPAFTRPATASQGAWTVDIPRAGNYAVWVLAEPQTGDRVEFAVQVAGSSETYWHYGPFGQPGWNAVGLSADPVPTRFALPKGRVPISITVKSGKATVRAVVVSDDPGYDPMHGISRFGSRDASPSDG